MKTEIYEKLERLYQKFGAREFGKICQKFLAIAFKKAGFKYAAESERGVQGIDIGEAVRGNEKYSIEVKTTRLNTVQYGLKDEMALLNQKSKGFQPVLAVLKLDRFSSWFFVRADNLKHGSIFIDRLRAYRLHELENEISRFFDEVINEHFENTLREGQSYLDRVLKQMWEKV